MNMLSTKKIAEFSVTPELQFLERGNTHIKEKKNYVGSEKHSPH